jgi:uncharacterized protein YkwD
MSTTAQRLLLTPVLMLAIALCAAPAEASRGIDECDDALQIPQSNAELTDAAASVICLVNVERTTRGIEPLRRDADLSQAARRHALDMTRRGYFAHVGPSGERLGDRLRDAGYGGPGDGWRAGEDLGWGTGPRATPNALVDAWLASDPHRRILLSRAYEEIGVGVAAGAPKPGTTELPGATYAMDLATIRPG